MAAEAAMLSATCYLLPLITVRWLVLVGVSTSLTRLSLVLSHTARRSLNPGEKNEASFTTHLSASAATAVGPGCLRRTDRRSALQIKIIPSEMHHQHGLRHALKRNVKCSSIHGYVSRRLQQIAIMQNPKTLTLFSQNNIVKKKKFKMDEVCNWSVIYSMLKPEHLKLLTLTNYSLDGTFVVFVFHCLSVERY